MNETEWLSQWDELVGDGNNSRIEEFWLNSLEAGVDRAEPFMEALRRLRSAGKKTLAASLLELGEAEATARDAVPVRKSFVRELLRLGIGDDAEQRAALEECVRRTWPDQPSLDEFLGVFNLREARKPVDALDSLEIWLRFDVGTVVAMNGRGPGRIVEANPKLGMLRVDLEREKRVPVPIDAAQKFLTPLPEGHFLRRRLEDKDGLRAEVLGDPGRGLELVLQCFDEPVGVPEVKATLEGLVSASEWTSWWNKAKKNPRLLASGSGTKVRYRLADAQGAGLVDEIRREFEGKDLVGMIDFARRHGDRDRELSLEMGRVLVERAAEPTAPGDRAWEALAVAERVGVDGASVDAARRGLLARVEPRDLLRAVGDASQRESLLVFIRTSRREDWVDVFEARIAEEGHPRLLTLLAAALDEAGAGDRLEAFLDRVYLHPPRHPDAFVWACERSGNAIVDRHLDARHTGALLVRVVEIAERGEFMALRPRLKAILSPTGVAGRILQERLTVDQARRLMQILERPGELSEERAWLRRSVPTRFSQLNESAAQETAIPVLAVTLRRLQTELKKLVERDIPDTLKAIQEARSMGDLRENFEYHAARARQELLSAQAAKLQGDIAHMRVIDPSALDLTKVRVGACVTLTGADGVTRRELSVLGPYEADADRGVLSHESEAGEALLDAVVGDTIAYDGEEWTVTAIAAVDPARLQK